MTNEKIPPGYKKTDVGVIPEDWEVKNFDNILISIPTKDYQLQTTEYKNIGKYPIIDQGQKSIVGFSDREEKVFFDIQDGVIIFGDHTRIVKYYIRPFIVGADGVKIIKRKKEVVDLKYVYYYLNLHKIPETGYNRHFKFLKEMNFLLPPLSEQRAIARVLSDVDRLIESLDKLIEKKKMIKKGAMQELLTGKKRLPGFTGEWVRKKLGEIYINLKGKGLSKSKIDIKGKYECILYGELFTTYKEEINKIKSKTNYFEGVLSKYGDILLPASTTTTGIDLAKASAILKDNVLLGGDIIILRSIKNINSVFVAYYLTEVKKNEISEKTHGITIHHLRGKDLLDIYISIPPTLEEQQAIAQILSDMDVEIEALQKKKEKYEMIKKGMMELLLTGKVRVKEENGKIRRLRV